MSKAQHSIRIMERRVAGEAAHSSAQLIDLRELKVTQAAPQFAPAFNALENEQDYLAAMDEVAREKGVGVFPRYEIMKYWFETEQMPYARFIARDGLHMNDYGYTCIGRLLAQAIERSIGK